MAEPVIPRGTPLGKVAYKYTRQCTHRHVSGRRCAVRIPKEKTMCALHPATVCADCNSMMDAFAPPKGW